MKASSGSTSSSAVGAVGALSAGAGASSDVGAGLRCCLESSSSPPKTAAGSAFFAVGFLPPKENAFILPATPDLASREALFAQNAPRVRTNASSKSTTVGGQWPRPDERGGARARGEASCAKQPACSQLRGLVAFFFRFQRSLHSHVDMVRTRLIDDGMRADASANRAGIFYILTMCAPQTRYRPGRFRHRTSSACPSFQASTVLSASACVRKCVKRAHSRADAN